MCGVILHPIWKSMDYGIKEIHTKMIYFTKKYNMSTYKYFISILFVNKLYFKIKILVSSIFSKTDHVEWIIAKFKYHQKQLSVVATLIEK